MAYDPAQKFNQPEDACVLVGIAPTDAEIAEAQGRIDAGENSIDVWAEIDRRCAARFKQRKRETK